MTSTHKLISSALQNIQAGIPVSNNHPFAAGSEDSYAYLEQVTQAADQIINSLDSYLSIPWSQPKLVSSLRQQSNLTSTLHSVRLLLVPVFILSFTYQLIQAEKRTKEFAEALRDRASTTYSEDIPLEPTSIANFCISRFEEWSTQAGLESFKDEQREGNVTIVLGGKVLVIDVDFSINKEDPTRPRVHVASVKTSYATMDDASGTPSNFKGSISLDAFLAETIQKYCDEVQKRENDRDGIRAAKLAANIQQQLRYLVMLDRLAEKKDGPRAAWFVDTDELCHKVEGFAASEAGAVAS